MDHESFEHFLQLASSMLASHGDLEDLQKANEYISLALQIRPADGRAWILKGYIMSCLEDDSAALAAAEMAGRVLPRDPEVHYVKAAALADMALFDQALDAVATAFELMVDHGDEWLLEDLYFLKGSLLEAIGHQDEAMSTYDQGLGQCPDSLLLREAATPLQQEFRRRRLRLIDGGRQGELR